MDVESFIEKDILEFFEGISAESKRQEAPTAVREEEITTFNTERDYAKDTASALALNDVNSARAIFFDLKKQFDSFPDGSADKRKAYDIMMEVRNKIQAHLSAPRSVPKPVQTQQITTPLQRVVKPKQAEEQVTREDVLFQLEKMKALMTARKAKEASEEYSKVKEMFGKMQTTPQEKEKILKEMVALHSNLRSLEEYAVAKKQTPKNNTPVIKEPEKISLVEQINKDKIKAYKYLDHDEPKSAEIQYRKLLTLIPKVENEDERTRFQREVQDLHDRIINSKKKNVITTSANTSLHPQSSCAEEVKEIQTLLSENKINEANKKFLDLQHKAVKLADEKERKEIYQAMGKIRTRINLSTTSARVKKRVT